MNPAPLARSLILLAGLAAGNAYALNSIAWSDARLLPAESENREDLERAKGWTCPQSESQRQATAQAAIKQLEESLKRFPAGDPNRAAWEKMIADMKKSAAQQPAARPAAPQGPLSLATALANSRSWLARGDAAGLGAFEASPDARDALKANQAAMAAGILGKPSASLAALLAAHKLAPKDADTLVNLGGVLTTLGLHAEALAALEAADKLKLSQNGALGWPKRAVFLNNRGHALLKLGRPAEAEKALRAALALEPRLAEASLNLSRSLVCTGKTEEAVRFYRRGVRRTPPAPTKPGPNAPVEPTTELPRPEPGEKAPEETQRPAAFIFDLSRGKDIALPNLKLPQTPADAVALYPQYKKLYEELNAKSLALSKRGEVLAAQLRRRKEAIPAVAERRDALWWAILKTDDEPRLIALERAMNKSGKDVSDIWTDFWHCEGGCTIDEIITKAGASDNYKQTFRDLCIPELQGKNNSWRGALHNHATNVGQYLKASYRVQTGLAANYSDPVWHERASLQAEWQVVSAFAGIVQHAMLWAFDVYQYRDGCVEGGEDVQPSTQKVADELELKRSNGCTALFDKANLALSIKVVEFSVSCETAAIKAATPGWIGVFGKIESKMDMSEFTVSAGAQEGVSIPNTGLEVKSSQGFYVTVGKEGIKDIGVQAEAKASASLKSGPIKIGGAVKGWSGKWSFISSTGT